MQVQPRDRAAELGDLHVVVPNECGCIRANVLLLRVPCVRVVWCVRSRCCNVVGVRIDSDVSGDPIYRSRGRAW